ncbi:hypothetical protein O181_049554 [Austropuccinia psidii MF-1]|uniref:Uncharacterized protein n=1 Tax=Austropuccinia psidii MF-1 TaxID=1389203 RepID=A0A9Q3DV20_9BASI|nr:hypothetical protein [Austropuccinia psidii MF-1]
MINSQGVVKILRRIAYSPTDPNAEGSDELDGEEVEVVPHSIGHQFSTSPSQLASRIFQSQVIPSTPETSSQSFPKSLLLHQTFYGFTSEAITHSTAQKLSNGHLPKTATCGQLQQKTRILIAFSNSGHPIISEKRNLAYPGYQRRSKYGK